MIHFTTPHSTHPIPPHVRMLQRLALESHCAFLTRCLDDCQITVTQSTLSALIISPKCWGNMDRRISLCVRPTQR